MPNNDPFDDIEKFMVRGTTVILTITAAVSVIGREWHEIISGGSYSGGIVAAVAGLLVFIFTARLRR
jgi:hypothetical protein